jgi:probable HAF family extracellular repeat protein
MSSMRVKIISHVRRVTIPAALLLTILAVAGVPAPAAGQTTGSTGTVQDPPPVSCITDSPVDPLGPGYLLDRGEFATIDHPKAGLETAPYGINNQGQIVGGYDGPGFIFHGFLLDRGRYSTFDLPGASKTTGLRINDRGQILGLYEDARGGCHGFLLDQGRYTTIDFPGAPTQTLGLNDHGDVVGTYVDIDGETRRNVAFMRDKDGYSPIPIPGALQSAAFDINDQGQVLGAYLDKDGTSRYFVFGEGDLEIIDVLGAVQLLPFGINNRGHVVGFYLDTDLVRHGFIFQNGTVTTIDHPLASLDSEAHDINDRGQIVGLYESPGSRDTAAADVESTADTIGLSRRAPIQMWKGVSQ